jgi:hypothetical protein
MIKRAVLLGTILSSSHAQHVLNSSELLELAIAKEGMTRISIEGDEIEEVFAYPSDAMEGIQKHANHMFLVGENIYEPIYMTLITRGGMTQDIRITSKGGRPHAISLKSPQKSEGKNSSEDGLVSILQSFLSNHIHPDFRSVPVIESSRSSGGIEATAVHAYESHRYRITEFIVKNTANKTVTLNPSMMWDDEDHAVVFVDEALGVSGTSRMYSVQLINKEGSYEN